MIASQSIVKLEKISDDDWGSPSRIKINKRKEVENSEDESEKHSSSEENDGITDLICSPDNIIKSR